MKRKGQLEALTLMACTAAMTVAAADNTVTNNAPTAEANSAPRTLPSAFGSVTTNNVPTPEAPEQWWNWHVQNTDIGDFHPSFPTRFPDGPNSLHSYYERQETVSVDLMGGVRLWPGAEFHLDGLMWQGFGFTHTLGIEAFPNAESYRVGTQYPNAVIARAFVRQTIGLGGEQEDMADDELHLAGKVDVSRITLTAGKMSAIDIFDNNTYANNPRTQFQNWALVANEAWDYPADSLGYMTGFAAELNQPHWTARYGFFQVPKESNGLAMDQHFLEAWDMVMELERRYTIYDHPGTIRLLGYLNHADMGEYENVVNNPALNIIQTRGYRFKYGLGLNAEQELVKGLGAFLRLGWSDGHTEAWAYSDVDRQASFGLSLNGAWWRRPNDTLAAAGVLSGLSRIHQEFFEAGGTGVLAGDGYLNYAWEEVMETYYDFQIYKNFHAALDYQFVANPAFNQDRGPVSIFGARLHWDF